ncbi:protein 60A-like [Sitodiplosis mosellana]|uniref:protein 60A-like n=1 Tax=Sitodiplosis mosellana TaxID=263140 RepID=UPI0024444E6E|nr:protein 60A-like [Sitodiplosis mosellana]
MYGEIVLGFSGLYGDNGIDQTIKKKNIPRADIQRIRSHILEMVGLPKREHFHHKVHHNRSTARKSHKSVPKFLWKIYERLSEDEDERLHLKQNRLNEENDGFTDEHDRIIELSDTIMTFMNNRNAFPNPENETRLSFDLSGAHLNGIELMMSELHLFKRQLPEKHFASNPCVITIYALTFPNGVKELHAIQTAETTVGFEGWIQINTTSTFREWLTEKKSNNMLYITVEYENELGHLDTPSISVNYLLSYTDGERLPFITAYFENNETNGHVLKHGSLKQLPSATTHRRSKRSTRSLKPKKPKNSKSSSRVNHLLHPKKSTSFKGCSRHTLYITFKQLRFDDWIFAPAGYEAYYCAGSCDFPFSHHVEVTRHAVLQELAHLMISHTIPKPCCAPSKLQPVKLLYEQSENNFSIKKYRGMIVTKCACQ